MPRVLPNCCRILTIDVYKRQMVGCAKMGLHFTACAPKKYQPDAALIAQCQACLLYTSRCV